MSLLYQNIKVAQPGKFGNYYKAIVDTGSSQTFLSPEIVKAEKLPIYRRGLTIPIFGKRTIKADAVQANIELENSGVVLPMIVLSPSSGQCQTLLGLDYMKAAYSVLQIGKLSYKLTPWYPNPQMDEYVVGPIVEDAFRKDIKNV